MGGTSSCSRPIQDARHGDHQPSRKMKVGGRPRWMPNAHPGPAPPSVWPHAMRWARGTNCPDDRSGFMPGPACRARTSSWPVTEIRRKNRPDRHRSARFQAIRGIAGLLCHGSINGAKLPPPITVRWWEPGVTGYEADGNADLSPLGPVAARWIDPGPRIAAVWVPPAADRFLPRARLLDLVGARAWRSGQQGGGCHDQAVLMQ